MKRIIQHIFLAILQSDRLALGVIAIGIFFTIAIAILINVHHSIKENRYTIPYYVILSGTDSYVPIRILPPHTAQTNIPDHIALHQQGNPLLLPQLLLQRQITADLIHPIPTFTSFFTNQNTPSSLIPLTFQHASAKDYHVHIPILMYHYIRTNPVASDTEGYNLSVTPNDFATQMQYLIAHGYQSISISELTTILKEKLIPSSPVVVLTFDDGYEDFYTQAFPILEKYHLKAESYVISGFVGQPNFMNWDMIRKVASSGLITIGDHTVNHLDLTTLDKENIDWELQASKQKIEHEIGKTVTDFCYPAGRYNDLVIQEVKTSGYTNATTTTMGNIHTRKDIFTLSRIRVEGGEDMHTFIQNLQ